MKKLNNPFVRVMLVILPSLVLIAGGGALWLGANAQLPIPKPGGPYPIGFSSAVLVDASRSNRVVTLHSWYPASSTAGTSPEPRIEKALAALLAQYQGIPDIGGESPSHAFRDAPGLPGKHPVLIFNHGYGSFTKQNSVDFEALASNGWRVISIGHARESLRTSDVAGNPVDFDAQSPVYQRMLQLQTTDLKAYVNTLVLPLQAQRTAQDVAAHTLASHQLANTAPYDLLDETLRAWAEDTRYVIARLAQLPGADPARVVVMGHSLGGTVALEIGKNPPAGVLAIINLDGPWLSKGAQLTSLRVPALLMLSTQNVFEGQNLALAGTFDPLLKQASAGAHVIEIAGSSHFNFTDLSYVPIIRYFSPVIGPVDGGQMMLWQRTAIAEFVRRVETGDTSPAPLLAPDARVAQRHFPAR